MGYIEVFISCPTDLMANIDVLGVHEIVFAKQTDLHEHVAIHHHTCAGDRFHFLRILLIAEKRRIPPERRFRPYATQEIRIQDLVRDRRERLNAAGLDSLVPIEQFTADRTCVRKLPQRIQHDVHCRAGQFGVRIQEQYAPTSRLVKRCIVCLRKPSVPLTLYESYLGVALSEHFIAAVERCIVDHHDLELDTVCLSQDRGDALPEILLGIPVDDDDGQIQKDGNLFKVISA